MISIIKNFLSSVFKKPVKRNASSGVRKIFERSPVTSTVSNRNTEQLDTLIGRFQFLYYKPLLLQEPHYLLGHLNNSTTSGYGVCGVSVYDAPGLISVLSPGDWVEVHGRIDGIAEGVRLLKKIEKDQEGGVFIKKIEKE